MSTLGRHARVYIGWCPPNQRQHNGALAMCRTGTIVDGPFDSGAHAYGWRIGRYRSWAVAVDGRGLFLVAEWLLTPVDGGDRDAARTDRELEATT